jgi:hypothetical protein
MKIPLTILAVILGAILTVCGWTMLTVVDLKTAVSGITVEIAAVKEQLKTMQPQNIVNEK